MHLRDKLSLRETAKRTGLSRNTLRKWLRGAQDVTMPHSLICPHCGGAMRIIAFSPCDSGHPCADHCSYAITATAGIQVNFRQNLNPGSTGQQASLGA